MLNVIPHSYNMTLIRWFLLSFITARIRRMTGGYIFTLCVSPHLDGGGRSQVQVGGWYPIKPWMGGVPGLRFSGGVPGLRFSRGGPGSQVSDFPGGVPGLRFSGRGPQGKNFDTRFGLIHVQTGEKKFLSRDPPSKEKNF